MRAKHFIQMAVVMMVVVGLGLNASPAPADMISLESVADSKKVSTYPDAKPGAEQYVALYGNSGNGMLIWSSLKFDLSSIPTGQVITSAILKLTTNYTSESPSMDTTAGVYRITKDWVEANVTWNDANTSDPWGTAGGDFVGTTGTRLVNPYAAFTVPKNAAMGSVHTVDVTNLVGEWYAGTYSNYGMDLAAEMISGQFYRSQFASKEDTTYAGPTLEVTYVPEPGTLALLATGLIGLLCYAWRKRR